MTRDMLLMAYVDGELSPEQAAAVERLLTVDSAARRQVAADRAVLAMLREVGRRRAAGAASVSRRRRAPRARPPWRSRPQRSR
jgi:anti-sigma factor RsiW